MIKRWYISEQYTDNTVVVKAHTEVKDCSNFFKWLFGKPVVTTEVLYEGDDLSVGEECIKKHAKDQNPTRVKFSKYYNSFGAALRRL